MNDKSSLICLALVVAFLFEGCRGPAHDVWTVKLSHVYATNTDYQQMAERFRDLMQERTDGRFRVVIYPSGQLGDERVTFEQLQFGAQQMAISGTPVLSGRVPEGQIFDLPFLFKTREEGVIALKGTLGNWWRNLLLEKTGVRSLGFLEYGFRRRVQPEASDRNARRLERPETPRPAEHDVSAGVFGVWRAGNTDGVRRGLFGAPARRD